MQQVPKVREWSQWQLILFPGWSDSWLICPRHCDSEPFFRHQKHLISDKSEAKWMLNFRRHTNVPFVSNTFCIPLWGSTHIPTFWQVGNATSPKLWWAPTLICYCSTSMWNKGWSSRQYTLWKTQVLGVQNYVR